ncbi:MULTISPECIES: hypothetical protein [Rhizobium]|uniref:Uncharacterized protein n=1 Tax=Rhizobium phaseoli TaxID=396 RepID=A0A7X6J1Y3_9HYPH|nr:MULTISPECIES: hypothetical protein [Rhizobium]MDE8761236.1 hypothetical protein [Rhizobium sp. CBK13]NKF12956.1 hypothetical protein [Rhizobium phaseoli]QPK10772.1 hypothetical protein HER27_009605 [Rhizobium phaseoli]
MATLINVTQLREIQPEIFEKGSKTWINADRIFRVDSVAVEVEELGTAQASRIVFDNALGRLLVLETPLELAMQIDGSASPAKEAIAEKVLL